MFLINDLLLKFHSLWNDPDWFKIFNPDTVQDLWEAPMMMISVSIELEWKQTKFIPRFFLNIRLPCHGLHHHLKWTQKHLILWLNLSIK
jgi:hypothetical protein